MLKTIVLESLALSCNTYIPIFFNFLAHCGTQIDHQKSWSTLYTNCKLQIVKEEPPGKPNARRICFSVCFAKADFHRFTLYFVTFAQKIQKEKGNAMMKIFLDQMPKIKKSNVEKFVSRNSMKIFDVRNFKHRKKYYYFLVYSSGITCV